jgi:hypothetical protein
MVRSGESKKVVRSAAMLLPATLVLAAVAFVLPAAGGAAAEATAPKNTGEPTITGQAEEGRDLSASTGSWSGTTPLSFAYHWVRCGADGGLPDGSNCVFIGGSRATKAVYRVVRADVGFRMRVRVTATNSAGSDTAASNATQTVVGPPVNTSAPTVQGTLVDGSVVTANAGTWAGRQPIQFSYRWIRCNAAGGACVNIGGATGRTYQLRSADVGHKMRFYVTARNAIASRTALSSESAVVTEPLPTGAVKLPTGAISVPVTSIPRDQRLLVAQVSFTPGFVRSRKNPISVHVKVQDTRGYVVRDALVFVRSTPRVTTGATQPTALDGTVTFQLVPLASFPAKRSAVQFFVKAYRTGDPVLGGVAGYRLVQVLIDTRQAR